MDAAAPGPLAAGSGHSETAAGLREFTFHAIGQPDGPVNGSYKVPNGLFFEADVTCLAVDGTTAWVAGTIRATNAGAIVVGGRSMFYAVDNGEGDDASRPSIVPRGPTSRSVQTGRSSWRR
jgi:hypothetical protein